ncbi:hypothetical protein [Brevifollis gellanilyticus]|uniref:Lipoprotein n=1 Tax=Brevifollis gellanilyticus TaxID=748831 RepID=A0A512M5C6_9BACT|nr:hypothetical protein [Brevifollis gellanilyticus]GEP41933.1 hypothetical protein BGE01nite_12240 [Brevifollis gellanilyticus]
MKTAAFIFGLALSLVCVVHAQETGKTQAERVAVLKDKRINESSGLAVSLREPGVFWTLNDSSGEPCVYAIDQTGKTRGKIRIPNAVNFDWEDLASAKAEDGTPHLYIADIGDNLGVRPTITVYEIAEPSLPKDAGKEELSAEPKVWHVKYPDGHHNAETLLVHPLTHRIYVLTKREDGHSALYLFPEKLVSGVPGLLQKIAAVEFPNRHRLGKRPLDASQTTGGAFSQDGRRIAIATYSDIHEWTLKADDKVETVLPTESRIIEVPLTSQMEAVCYDAGNETLWFTSERLPTPLWRIKR